LLSIQYRRLILACGARELFLPFDGWTLPGVYGAGGLQALVKSGFDVRGKKVVVAGSGPLLIAVAAYLRQRGAEVSLIAEQAPRGKLARFGGWLLRNQPGKIAEALGLGWQLGLTPYRAGCWPIRGNGASRLESVTLTDGTNTWTQACDALACGFGLIPNLELPLHLGCAIENGVVKVDEKQQTSSPGIYAVGELTGIGGLDKALLEGQIAGGQAVDHPERALPLLRARDRARRFVSALDQTFALRDELRHLAAPDTFVCRCEDVTYGQLTRHADWRDAKLQTRCGMGPCQGRICGPAVNFLFGWTNDSIRPPLFPTALGNLTQADLRMP
jgi:NADPH-dependent 2,4-dienoyl-CoA reductase/sulfur reductase-like enzyme